MAAGDFTHDNVAAAIGDGTVAEVAGAFSASAAALGNLAITAGTGKTISEWRSFLGW